MKNRSFLALILLLITCSLLPAGYANEFSKPGSTEDTTASFEKEPFWYDEFDYSGVPDTLKWGYDIGGHGWGNQELQYYTDDIRNSRVNDGKLIITAIRENIDNNHYTSARLVTKNKGDLLYGRVEVKARIPSGRGTWPAIWMLPTDWEYGGWPSSGEIDIMEHVGYNQDHVHISTHCEAYYWILDNQKTAVRKVPGVSKEFHVYRIDWTPSLIKGFIDGELVFTNQNEGTGYKAWPFDKRFHLIVNIAVGGGWGGKEGIDEGIFPASMEIDYVRFYRYKADVK